MSSHTSGHHPGTVRLAGRKRHARFESSGALAEQPAVARTAVWSCMDAAPGCRLQRRSSADILTAWPGRVAQAPRAGRARAPWSCSPCWRPSSRTARLRDQLGLDDEASSQIADGGATGSRLRGGTSVGDLPASSVIAVQLIPETMCSARTPPVRFTVCSVVTRTSKFNFKNKIRATRTNRLTHTSLHTQRAAEALLFVVRRVWRGVAVHYAA